MHLPSFQNFTLYVFIFSSVENSLSFKAIQMEDLVSLLEHDLVKTYSKTEMKEQRDRRNCPLVLALL